MATRGIRNNNPGNLRITAIPWMGKIWPGNTDGEFEQFTEMKFGIRALMKDLINDYSEGKDTIRKMINEYAPSHENDTTSYINSVSNQTGIPADARITLSTNSLKSLTRAIINHENGFAAASSISSSEIDQAFDLLGPTNMLETIVIQARKPINWLSLLAIGAGVYFGNKYLTQNKKQHETN